MIKVLCVAALAWLALVVTSHAVLIGSEVGEHQHYGAGPELACVYFNGMGSFTVIHRYSPVVQWGTTTTCPTIAKN